MKTILLFLTFTLAFISASIAKNNPSEEKKWFNLTTGRYYHLRVSAFENGLEKLIRDNYEASANLNRKSLNNTHRFNFAAYNNYGVSVARMKRFDQAIGLFKKSMVSGGQNDFAWFNIFVTSLNRKQYSEALHALNQIPFYLKASYPEEAGTCYLMNGKFREAYQSLKLYVITDSINASDVTYYNASLSALMVGDITNSILFINKAIAKNKTDFQYHLHKGKIFLNINPEISQSAFEKALKLNPGNLECQMGLGYTHIISGRSSEAVKLFESLIKKGHNKNPDIYQALSIALGQLDRNNEAIGEMEEVGRLRNFNNYDLRILGDLWLNNDSVNTALSYYQQAMNNGFDPDAALGITICYFLNDELKESLEMIRSIDSITPDYRYSDYGKFVKAMVFYCHGLLDEFNETIGEATFGKNRESGKLMIMAMKAISQFQYANAQKQLKKAMKIDPENVNLKLIFGTLQFQLTNYNEAASIFNSALQNAPDNVEIKNSLALTYSNLKKGDLAIAMMKDVLNTRPLPRYYNNMALVMIDKAGENKTEFDAVCVYYEMAIQYVDSALAGGINPAFRINKGNAYLYLKDTLKALEHFADPSTSFSINNTGLVSYLDGNVSEALQLIETAIEESEENVCPTLYYNQAYISGTIGREYPNEGPMFISLYQVMPAVLPDFHIFSYSFTMQNNKPIHKDGDYLIYTSLEGTVDDSKSIKNNNKLEALN